MAPRVASAVKKIFRSRSIVKSGATPFVVLPLEQWEQIEDIVEELGSPKLLRSIAAGRAASAVGRTVSYSSVRKSLGLT